MGLLTKIFGGPDGGGNAGEPASTTTPTASPAGGEGALPALPAYTKGEHGNSGIRPAVEAPTQRAREATRPNPPNRRPEHPRMYLRPTPASLDPTLPGSTRRQQISVRPSGGKFPTGSKSPSGNDAVSRAPAPPSKRGQERNNIERGTLDRSNLERGASRAAEEANRRDAGPESTPPGLRLPRARPRPTMVVSPVSLTAEQLALPPGARQKMPTLLGLGTAIGEVLARESKGSTAGGDSIASAAVPSAAVPSAAVPSAAVPSAAAPGPAVTASSDAAPLNASNGELSNGWAHANDADQGQTAGAEASDTVGSAAALLADFALELSIGPLSSAWADDARRAVRALAPIAEQRQQASLAAVLARVLELLPDADPSSPLSGALREQLVHELTRLAGLLPEWPAPAQDLAEEARRREVRIVRELLLAVDGTRRDQRARLEQQVRLEALGGMTAEGLAHELAAPVERGRELRRVLDTYFGERQTSAPDFERRRELGRALDRLEKAARAFDDADPEHKGMQRTLRTARRDAMSAVNILLAERGEHEWLDLLEPLSVGERIERLRHWLSVGAEGAGVEGPSSE